MNTPDSRSCPRCDLALPVDAPKGLCPRCLAAMNLAEETAFTGADAVAAQTPLAPAELAPHFPQLEILEYLGRGGMGVVYKARQKSLNRFSALKLLAPERAKDPSFAARFAREAQALAALNHPHIVGVYDFGEAGGFYFLLMEFVDGVNLRQAMQGGRFTPEQALAIVPPVCEALQYAHEHGIVHRDIKPENLLLDRDGRVKIADFGIAKLLHAEASGAGFPDSQPAGTPQYMAPEQRAHRGTDHRADIYSLGVVLYELLTGELPADKLQPPSRKVQLDVRLDEIVLRALEQTPELRYQTAGELRTQVETLVATHESRRRTEAPSAAEGPSRPPLAAVGEPPRITPTPMVGASPPAMGSNPSSASATRKRGTAGRIGLVVLAGLLLVVGISAFNRSVRLAQERQDRARAELAALAAAEALSVDKAVQAALDASDLKNKLNSLDAENAMLAGELARAGGSPGSPGSPGNSRTVALSPDGTISLAGELVTLEAMRGALATDRTRTIVIRANETVPLAIVTGFVEALKAYGGVEFSFQEGQVGDGRFRVANRTGKYDLGNRRDLYLCRPEERSQWFTVMWPAADGKRRQQWSIYPKVSQATRGKWAVAWEPGAEVLWWVDDVDVGRMRLTNPGEVLVKRESRTGDWSPDFGLPEEVRVEFRRLGFVIGADSAPGTVAPRP